MALSAVAVKLNSIQEYIFHSNRLKENIGASYITSYELFHVCMKETLISLFAGNEGILNYYEEGGKNGIEINNEIFTSTGQVKCVVADIGGGGALLLFKDSGDATVFIERFSKAILLRYPGLKTSFAQVQCDVVEYNIIRKKLNEELNKNKNEHTVNSTIQKHGITSDCPLSNESAEFEYDDFGEVKFVSAASYSRLKHADESSRKDKELLTGHKKHSLTTDIENLGQNHEASYIAVVHIDGNGMGALFRDIDSFKKLREASYEVQNAAKNSMKLLIDDLVGRFSVADGIQQKIKLKNDDYEGKYLPIRPILAGGDDITFVCEGRLGVYLAEKFIKCFVGTNVVQGACAGVAIVKTHFPFYKAYDLAVELCHEAKERCRTKSDEKNSMGKSYLSYYYSATTFSGSLKQLRQRTHKVNSGSLYYGPYNVFDNSAPDWIENLKAGIRHFQNEKEFPKNKTMRLREVLAESESAQTLFLKEITEIHKHLTKNKDGKNAIWYKRPNLKSSKNDAEAEKVTPYFDQIELKDFYPKELL